MRVFVYWHTRKKLWSIKAMEGFHKGNVIYHANALRLDHARFHVQDGGRKRVLREGQKNVHAGVVGELVAARGPGDLGELPAEVGNLNDPPPLDAAPHLAPVHYVPAMGPYFFWVDTLRPVTEAAVVLLEPDKEVLAAPQESAERP